MLGTHTIALIDARANIRSARVAARRPPDTAPRRVPTRADRMLALQRAAGNRAAGRTLARWAAHPDPAKKGELMTDAAAAAYLKFNPPQNR